FSGSDVCSGTADVTNNYGTARPEERRGCGETGSVSVTFTLTDGCGNDITSDKTFTIVDTTDPVWTAAPSNSGAECDGAGNASDINTWLNSFSGSDACSGTADVTNNYGTAGHTLSNGRSEERRVGKECTLTDGCGNDIK